MRRRTPDARTRPGRRRLAAAIATTVAATGLATTLGHRAHADAGLAAAYPAGATTTWFAGRAFDACDAPPRAVMKAWRSSPYGALGIYISGDHRACGQNELDAAWVRDVSAMGWKFLPLDVGKQAPCADNRRLRPMSSDPRTASTQGGDAAAGAVQAAAALGILPGSAIYADIEGYDPRDKRCGEAVRAYLSGWTGTLHAAGYLAGVYGNLSSGMRGLSDGYLDATYTRPDVVWNAHWDGQPNLTGWRGVPDRHWSGHQRVKQYRGDHFERHGGYRVNIDSNAVDAPVATVAHPLPITLPETGDSATATEWAVCRVGTDTDAWSMLTDGTYVPDIALAPGAATSPLPTCVRPYQVLEDAELHGEPAGTAPVRGAIPAGALAWVRCETPALVPDGSAFWHRLENGHWIDGAALARTAPGRSAGVPRCAV